ncbi:hypothetical protein KQI52_03130 [bacterium]|nr:hypothetical protein [bacterium]
MLNADDLQNRTIHPAELFEQLADKSREIFNRGKTLPLVVVDVDDCLLDKRPRVMKVLADLIMDQNPEIPLTDEHRTAIASIKPRTMKFDLKDTLRDVGIVEEGILGWIQEQYDKKATSDQYIMFDLPTPGIVDFIKELSKAGSTTLYLAGKRNRNKSTFGTERSLSMYELPAPRGEVGALFMSDVDGADEFKFKQDLIKPITEAGEVIAVFDNEPNACNLFRKQFPDASVVLVDTFRENEDELADGIHVVKNFLRT